MVKLMSYSYSVATGLTPYGPFTCSVDKINSRAGSPGLAGGGTSCSLHRTVCPFLLSEEGDVASTIRHYVVLVWIPSWYLD